MASTKTEHLTSLSFNLTDMKAQLDSIPASVQEAAIKAQKAWDDNFNAGFSPDGAMGSGTGRSGSGGGESGTDRKIAVTTDAVNRLIDRYTALQEKLAGKAFTGDQFSEVRTEVEQIINDLNILKVSVEAGFDLDENDSDGFVKARSRIVELNTELKQANILTLDFKNKVGGQAQQLSTSEYEKLISKLRDIQSQFGATQSQAQNAKWGDANVRQLGDTFGTVKGRVSEYIGSLETAGIATQEDAERVRMLESELKSLGIVFDEAANTAKINYAAEQQRNALLKESTTLTDKQSAAVKRMENSRQKSINRDTITSMKALNVETQELIRRFQAGEMSSDQFRIALDELIAKTRQLEGGIRTSGTAVNDFFTKVSDKTKWLASFYLIQGIINGFKALISTVKETETSVVELQRVLSEDVTSPEISSQLYDIAYEYGRTFDEVQESAVLFAQTGKSWNDVLTLTRGTMLALNTAELDVTQATQGLIAVMAQWDLGAVDYVELIDKINKTADDYAITSEAIVAALQRSGGTAKAYGMTLEELIGVITALGEATGRTGQNLGTAINSLITYTTKASSLNVLEEMGIQAKDAEGNLLPVLDIWSQLAQKIKGGDLAFADFMATDQAAMDTFLADSEEYQQAVADTIASGKEVQDAYSIAGTYRKNYFIALLNNLGTAEEAVRNMTDAEGYSATENERYMATLKAISNQLSASWKQLAVEFGDAGFLEFLKFISDAAIGMAKLIGNTGGLKVSLFALLGILMTIKAQQISEMITGWGQAFKTAVTGANAAKVAVTGLQAAFGWIGLVVTALSLLIGAINGANAAAEANRQKRLDAGDAAKQETESLNGLINKYEELARTADYSAGKETALASARSIHEDIVEILGEQADGWDLVNGKVDENIAKLREAQAENAKKNKADLESAMNAAQAALEESNKLFAAPSIADAWNIGQGFKKAFPDAEAYWYEELQAAFDASGASGVLTVLERWQEAFNDLGVDGVKATGALVEMIEKYRTIIGDADRTTKDFAENEAIDIAFKKWQSGAIGSQEAFDGYIESLQMAAFKGRMTKDEVEALIAAISDLYPKFAEASDTTNAFNDALSEGAQVQGVYTKSLEEISAAIKGITEDMDSAQGSVSTLQSIIDEYNETGTMSVDMLQQLMELEPEYIALLDVSSNGISLNQSATDALIESKLKLIETNLALKEAEYASAIAAEFNAYATDEAYDAANQSANASYSAASGLQALVSSAYSTGMSVESVAQQLYALGYVQSATGSKAIAMANQILTASQAMYTLRAAAGSALGTLASFTGTSAGGTGKSSGGGGGGGEDPQVKILEARKKAIEEEADAQIEALKKVQEAEDRKRRRDEYLADKSEALADVRRAQSRSGVDARQDEADAEKKLADVNKDWQEQLQDWNLDDQIASIEEWKDAMVDAIDAQLDALKSGGGGGGGGTIADVFSNEADVLTQNKDVLLAALAEIDSDNIQEKIKAFYNLFDASQYTSDVDFSEQLAGIKTDWDTFTAENGDDWAIHYKMVLDDGSTMTPEQINDYINGLLGKATSESELLQLDKEGLGILLRVTPDAETNKETEDQWSQTINDLGEALGGIMDLWNSGGFGTDEVKQAIEDAFNEAFDAAEQAATDSGVVIEQQMSKAADDTGASMLSSVNGYSPQIVDAWNNNLINPMIDGLGDLSDTLDGVLTKLGNVAAFGGFSGNVGMTGSTSNVTQSQNNYVTLRNGGTTQVDPLRKWFL